MKLFSSMQVSSNNLYKSIVRTPVTELSIWEVYVKHRSVFQIIRDYWVSLFIYFGIYVTLQIYPFQSCVI